MKYNIDERVLKAAELIVQKKSTIREVAKILNVSKSTIHNDLTQRLKKINKIMFKQVREILEKNKAERHIRGGEATKKKYLNKKLLNS